jgi:hypothetical protein
MTISFVQTKLLVKRDTITRKKKVESKTTVIPGPGRFFIGMLSATKKTGQFHFAFLFCNLHTDKVGSSAVSPQSETYG